MSGGRSGWPPDREAPSGACAASSGWSRIARADQRQQVVLLLQVQRFEDRGKVGLIHP